MADEGAEVLVAEGALGALIAAAGVPSHHRHVLKMAFAALFAHRTVVWMVLHQPFDDLLAKISGKVRVDGHPHAILHVHHAGHLQTAAPIVRIGKLNDGAQPAGADRAHGRMPAEVREFQVLGQHRLQQVLARRKLVVLAVYVDAGHMGVSP